MDRGSNQEPKITQRHHTNWIKITQLRQIAKTTQNRPREATHGRRQERIETEENHSWTGGTKPMSGSPEQNR